MSKRYSMMAMWLVVACCAFAFTAEGSIPDRVYYKADCYECGDPVDSGSASDGSGYKTDTNVIYYAMSEQPEVCYSVDCFENEPSFLRLTVTRGTGLDYAPPSAILGDGWGHPVPYVVEDGNWDVVILRGRTTEFFMDNDGPTLSPGNTTSLKTVSEEYEYRFCPEGTGRLQVFDFDANEYLETHTDTRGKDTDVTYVSGGGNEHMPETIERTASDTTGLLIDYDVNDQVSWVVLRRKASGPWAYSHNQRRAKFTYYGGDNHGLLGDLMFIELQHPTVAAPVETNEAHWETEKVWYFRYWIGDTQETDEGPAHRLKAIVEPAFFAKYGNVHGDGTPTVAETKAAIQLIDDDHETDPDMMTYASYFYWYDGYATSSVIDEAMSKGGIGGCSGGGATTALRENVTTATRSGYSAGTDLYNNWKTQLTVDLVDGDDKVYKRTTTFLNALGQVMMKVVELPDTPAVNPTAADMHRTGEVYIFHNYQYNDGQVMGRVENSAIDWEEIDDQITGPLTTWQAVVGQYADLMNGGGGPGWEFIKDDSGLIHVTSYGESTTATDEVAGNVLGYPSGRCIRQGDMGPVRISGLKYIKNLDGASETVYLIAQDMDDWVDWDEGVWRTTTYDYPLWHTGDVVVKRRITKRPAVEGTSPGTNVLITDEYFDTQGRLEWRKGEDGSITHWDYDATTGKVSQRIDDLDTGVLAVHDEAASSGWSNTDRLHLVTNYAYDTEHRLFEVLGPAHEAIVDASPDYPKKARRATWTLHAEGDGLANDQRSTVSGYVWYDKDNALQDDEIVGPIRVEMLCKLGRAVETYHVVEGAFTDGGDVADEVDPADTVDVDAYGEWRARSKTVFDDDGLLAETRVYHNIDTTGDGDPGADYIETTYGYDKLGRRIRTTQAGRNTQTFYNVVDVVIDGETIPTRCLETCVYPHVYTSGSNILTGPIRITLTDEDGRVVAKMTATSTPTLSGGLVTNPAALKDLEFLSFNYYIYNDWQGWRIESRTYSKLTGVFGESGDDLTIDTDNASCYYFATKVRAYDHAGNVLRREDAYGVIRAYVYDGRNRVKSEWIGTDDTDATRTDPGYGSSDLAEIRRFFYDENRDDSGSDRVPALMRVRSLTPEGTDIDEDGPPAHYTEVDYYPYETDTKIVEVAETEETVTFTYAVRAKTIKDEAWHETASDGVANGWSRVYTLDGEWGNHSPDALLAQADAGVDPLGRTVIQRKFEVDSGTASGPLAAATFTTKFTYNDAGLRETVTGPDGLAVVKTHYNAAGQVTATETLIDTDGDSDLDDPVDYQANVYEISETGTGRLTEIKQGTDSSDAVTVRKLWYKKNFFMGGVETFRLTGQQRIGRTGAFGLTELTFFEYDTSGRRNVTVLPDPDGSGSAVLHSTTIETTYDNAGRLTQQETTAEDGQSTVLADSRNVYSEVELDDTNDPRRVANQLVTHELYEAGETNHIDTSYYYDDYGRVCKVEYANGSFRKTNYGLTGYALNRYRCTAEYVAGGSNEDPDVVTDDIVVEQVNFNYDPQNRLIGKITYRRREDDETTTTGALSSADSRLTHHYYYYDVQGRMTYSTDYGTNTDTPPAAEPDADEPGANDDYLVTKFGYDGYGRKSIVTNDAAQDTLYCYDDAGRVTHIVENAEDTAEETAFDPSDDSDVGGPSGETDEDRVTKYEYDKLGQLEKQIALFPESDDNQTTWYVYSLQLADKGNPTVKSNRLLRGIIYGDSDDKLDTADPYEKDFDPGTDTIYDRVEFTYNQDHTIASRKDQRTVTLEFEYDFRRRQTLSKFVATRPAGVDDTVQAIGRAFDELGRVVTVTSYDDTAGPSGTGNEVNEVKYAYNDWGLVATSWQAHDGEVDDEGEGESPHVHYTCDTSGDLRLTKVEYPDNRLVHYTYGTADYINDRLSRVYQICDDDGGNPDDPFATYTYIGAETIINIAYNIDGTGNDLELSYGVWNATPASAYTGLDTHDRIITQEWTFDSTVKDKYTYDYDDASNRLYRENTETTGKDELYNYDGLNRLTLFHRGDLDNDKDEIPVVDRQGGEEWDLTATGGWGGYRWDRDMDGSYTSPSGEDVNHTRDLNKANEIVDTDEPPDGEAIEETTGPEWVDPEYDLAGNMIYMPQPMLEFSSSYAVTVLYDAWHRLTVIYLDVNSNRQFDSGTDRPVQSCVYDGLNRMVDEKLYSLHGEPSVVADWSHYYNTAWQVLEVRSFEHEGAGNENPLEQYVWCLRYIDSPIIRFFDADTDGSATTYPDADYDDASDSVLYYLTDANFNVTGLVDKGDGDVVERYQYDPYGRVTWLNADWSNSMRPESMNRVLFAGYRWSPTGLYYARNRYYHPTLGKWLTRDPIGYGDGMNLYEYCGGSPTLTTDPSGLFVIVVGGAAGAGDAGMRTIAEKMVNEERDWYDANQPRTLLLGTGYSLISSPTGGGPTLIGQAVAFGIPNWPGAVGKLEQAIAAYETYRLAVDFVNWGERLLGLPPECRTQAEKLHIIGFSDGATTISLWLWKARRQEHAYGLIMAIDLVRRGNRLGTFPKELLNVPKGPGDEVPGQIGLGDAPNMLTHTSLYVPQKANAKVYRAIAHQTPAWDVRIAAGVIQASWTGHNLTGWDGNELIKGGLHTDFPSNEALVRDVMTGLEEALKKFEEDE